MPEFNAGLTDMSFSNISHVSVSAILYRIYFCSLDICVCKISIWNINCVWAKAFIFDSRFYVLEKTLKFLRHKMSRSVGELTPNYSCRMLYQLGYRGQTFANPCFGILAAVINYMNTWIYYSVLNKTYQAMMRVFWSSLETVTYFHLPIVVKWDDSFGRFENVFLSWYVIGTLANANIFVRTIKQRNLCSSWINFLFRLVRIFPEFHVFGYDSNHYKSALF